MALTDIALCSRALLMIGAASIASFDEGTAEAEVAANLYPSVRDALLSAHPWNFALRQAWLARLVDGPVADYGHAYQMPADALRAVSAGIGARGRGIAYRVVGDRVHCDTDEIILTYIARVDEVLFPASFDQALIGRLAAEFCLPLTESTSRADFLYRLAEEELRRARLADAQEDSGPALQDFPLVEVRS
jgi:hypothetical protein